VVQLRLFLRYATAFVIVFGSTCVLVNMLACTPLSNFWTKYAGQLPGSEGGHCINIYLFFILSGAVNSVVDFVLLILVRVFLTYLDSADEISTSPFSW